MMEQNDSTTTEKCAMNWNVETPGTLSNSRATGEGSALSRCWFGGSNPLHDGTVPNPTGRTTPDVAGVDPDGRLTLEVTKLNSRQQLKIATWNVRTFHVAINRFNSSGEMEVLESELRRYNINVMGLAETKWKGKEGHYYTTEGNMVIHAENNVRKCGVGFIVDNTSSKAVIGYESVSNRVMASSVFTDECDNNTMLCPNVSV